MSTDIPKKKERIRDVFFIDKLRRTVSGEVSQSFFTSTVYGTPSDMLHLVFGRQMV
jgi:hypothetical protein